MALRTAGIKRRLTGTCWPLARINTAPLPLSASVVVRNCRT